MSSQFFLNNYNLIKENIPELELVSGESVKATDMTNAISTDSDYLMININSIPNYIPRIIGFDVTKGWNLAGSSNQTISGLKFLETKNGRNNPNDVKLGHEILKIPLVPIVAETPTDTTLGTVGVALNGVPIYNPFETPNSDSAYGNIFSSCCGHPQRQGVYHYHKYPTCLKLNGTTWKSENEKCNDIDELINNNGHSPLIGFALDGFPIYGPVGKKDGKSKIMKSSYTGKNDNNGNPLYIEGSGDLDECNGINSITPEYPDGIYHYVMTIESGTDGKVLRHINPYLGYDIRNILKKYSKMPDDWTNDSNYYSALLNGFTIDNIEYSGINNYNTFHEWVSYLVETLPDGIAAEFDAMKISYPFTIIKYKGTPSKYSVTSYLKYIVVVCTLGTILGAFILYRRQRRNNKKKVKCNN